MEPRIDLFTTEIGAKIAKRIYNVSLVIEQSPLPKATQALVSLRASQINGCGWCVDGRCRITLPRRHRDRAAGISMFVRAPRERSPHQGGRDRR